ncbi:MAG: DUF6115 domain-containing protein [Clostridiales bacterium]|nr:DUF6115 domain-containing protein [Clostridiales bacterium]
MSATEIVLIIIGVAIFLLGYLMPARKKDLDEEVQLISEDEVRKMVAGEIENVRDRISDLVDETVHYAIEKAERAMERVTNEKIMAVNEYSDTVLEEIHKNHKEVVFLYDMLNDKHDNLMSTINEATQAADGIRQTVKDAEITANEAAQKVKSAEDAANEAVDLAKEATAAAQDAAENVKAVQTTADEAREAVQAAMQSVTEIANGAIDLESLHDGKPYRAEVVEEVQSLMLYENEEKPPVKTEEGKSPEEEASGTEMPPEEEQVDFTPILPKRVEIIHQPGGDYVAQEHDVSAGEAFAEMGIFAPKTEEPAEPKRKPRARRASKKESASEDAYGVNIRFAKDKDNSRNSNERILELHKAGKSNMAIAKELGLGLGEVKLVIDLFEGM